MGQFNGVHPSTGSERTSRPRMVNARAALDCAGSLSLSLPSSSSDSSSSFEGDSARNGFKALKTSDHAHDYRREDQH